MQNTKPRLSLYFYISFQFAQFWPYKSENKISRHQLLICGFGGAQAAAVGQVRMWKEWIWMRLCLQQWCNAQEQFWRRKPPKETLSSCAGAVVFTSFWEQGHLCDNWEKPDKRGTAPPWTCPEALEVAKIILWCPEDTAELLRSAVSPWRAEVSSHQIPALQELPLSSPVQ